MTNPFTPQERVIVTIYRDLAKKLAPYQRMAIVYKPVWSDDVAVDIVGDDENDHLAGLRIQLPVSQVTKMD